MDGIIKAIFEKSRDEIYGIETKAVARVTNDAAARGLLFGGMYFAQVYQVYEKALRDTVLALIEAYRQVYPSPSDAIADGAKKDSEQILDEGLDRLRSRVQQSYSRAASTGKLNGELLSKLEPLRRDIYLKAIRDIDIWVGLSKTRANNSSNNVFVIMRIGVEDTDKYFNEVIRPAAKECGLNAFPVNLTEGENPITNRILENIRGSLFVICDLTYERPNCYFEAGYAMGGGVRCVFTARHDHDPRLEGRKFQDPKVHFDLDSMKITYWNPKRLAAARSELIERMKIVMQDVRAKSPESLRRFELEGNDL
ncbi:MAG TPA: hypothetical protein PK523_00415 [Elusimicrobiales bacterium]|nr:hypothetical protein [Elusimicrobiales bacterium]